MSASPNFLLLETHLKRNLHIVESFKRLNPELQIFSNPTEPELLDLLNHQKINGILCAFPSFLSTLNHLKSHFESKANFPPLVLLLETPHSSSTPVWPNIYAEIELSSFSFQNWNPLAQLFLNAVNQSQKNQQELQKIRQESQEIQHEFEHFLYIVSHDLRAPLRAISNLSQWIQEDLEGEVDKEVENYLNLLKRRTYRFDAMFESLLQYARLHKQKESEEEFFLQDLIQELLEELQPVKNFSIQYPQERLKLKTQAKHLRKIFFHLLQNAFRFHPNPNEGQVNIFWERDKRDENVYFFKISDNGSGIAEKDHERVFNVFQTLNSRDEVESSGMGLALVKKIVQLQQGKIWLELNEPQGLAVQFTWQAKSKE